METDGIYNFDHRYLVRCRGLVQLDLISKESQLIVLRPKPQLTITIFAVLS